VNSNVKLGRPDEAVAWVERAHELRDDSWSRLLLACYRARAGRAAEARELLRGVRPSPSLHDTLACTYALLGEADAALAWLERELDPAASSPGALRRQKDWAAQDPDLGSLRDDSRFKALVE
jgi:tetratricopeptide (TPR) repeat protein